MKLSSNEVRSLVDGRNAMQSEIARFLGWLFIGAFFIVAPAAFLYAAATILKLLSDPTSPTSGIRAFDEEKSQLLLAFYAGTVGGLISYGYGRIEQKLPSDPINTKITKLFTSALLGVALYLFINSAVFVRLFYPQLYLQVHQFEPDIYTVLLAALLAGLFGPTLISHIKRKFSKSPL